jgi:hypothetical protein
MKAFMLNNDLCPMNYGKEKGFFQTEGIFSPLLLQAVLQFLSQKQASFHLHAIPFSYVDLP